jgi:hypothetical protein
MIIIVFGLHTLVNASPFPVKPAFLVAAGCSFKSFNPSKCFPSLVCNVPPPAFVQNEFTALKMSDNDFHDDYNLGDKDDEPILSIEELNRDAVIEAMQLLGLPLTKIQALNFDFSLGNAMSIKTFSKTLFSILLFNL